MNQDRPGKPGSDDWRDCRPSQPESGCDPSSSIDESKCGDQGLAARLEYKKGHADALDKAAIDYNQARTLYRDRRHEAALKVQDMKHQVKHLLERIRCLIEQKRVIRCIEDAFCEVEGRLDCCEGPLGCCVDAIEFDCEPPEDYRELLRRIDRYQTYVDSAKKCFLEVLVVEPTRLTERVDAAKADLDKILAALAEDAAKVDLKKQYASALVLQRRLARIWNGYVDNAAYADCLCQALKTWTAGVKAVSLLTGAKAEQTCRREAATEWCATLIKAPVDEILVVYDRLCSPAEPCTPDTSDGSDDTHESKDPDNDHPEDCGCGHDHSHKRPDPERASRGS